MEIVNPILVKNKKEQSKTVSLSMGAGDQTITPDAGKVLSSVTVEKPSTLVSSNIKDGVEIGGVVGDYSVPIETQKTVPLDMASGDQTITPTSGYDGMEEVVVEKPSTLLAENIKNGVTIGGVTGSYTAPTPTLVTKNITANGTYNAASDNADGYSSVTVAVPATPAATIAENDVTFYDYDGTVVAAYTAAQFANLSAMPANPSHTGLVAEGWNWTLADAKTYVGKYGLLNIAQLYHTLSGAIEYDIEINEDNGYTATLGLNGTQKDWGDGTTNTLETHTYLQDGVYTIKLSGSVLPVIQNSKKVVEVRLSNNVSNANSNYIFKDCRALRAISISSQLQEAGSDGMFTGCTLLKFIALPWYSYGFSMMDNCCSLSNYSIDHGLEDELHENGGSSDCFAGCSALQRVCLQGDTIFGDFGIIAENAFENCISLKSVIMPDNIQYIYGNAFAGCNWLTIIKIYAQTPPPLDSTNAFPSTVDKIYIPSGTLADYQSETNWSAFSAKFVEMTV